MADQHDPRAHARQFLFQPLDPRQIQMVGRLVQQQNVRLRRQHPRQCRPPSLSARQPGRILGAGQPQLLQEINGPIPLPVVGMIQPSLDISQRRLEPVEIRLLRQIPDRRPRLSEPSPAIRLHQSRRHFQQSRFARSIAPDQANPVAGGHGNAGAGQQRGSAERQGDIL
jgi:hypothetical protein